MYYYFADAYEKELRGMRAGIMQPVVKRAPPPPTTSTRAPIVNVVPSVVERPIEKKFEAQRPLEEQPNVPVKLFECPEGCGRKFAEKALQKHVKVCQKVFQETREVFDSKVKREAEGQDQVYTQAPAAAAKSKNNPNKKKVSWKEKSEAFRLAMLAAKNPDIKLTAEQQEIMRVGSQSSDLVGCDYCGRKFNEQTALKHIPFCKSQQQKKKK